MPSDWAIRKVQELRARQRDQDLSVGLADPTGNRFDALIGELLDELRAGLITPIKKERVPFVVEDC